MVDNSATGNLAIDQEKNTTRTDSEQHVNSTNLSGSHSNHLVVASSASPADGILTMNLNHPNNVSNLPDTDAAGTVAITGDSGDRADESQSNNMPTHGMANSVANNSLISGVNSVAGNVANSPSSNLLGAAATTAAGSVVHNNSICNAPALSGGASVINSTVNNSSIISQPPITPSIQSSSSNPPSQQAAIGSASPCSNQPLASGHQLPATANPANNPTVPSFLPINSANVAATTTINLNNSNLPHLNAPVAASCPTAGNLIAQTPLPIASSAAMNTATSNSVANVDIQDDSEDESEILEESPCGRWLKRREEVGLTWIQLVLI